MGLLLRRGLVGSFVALMGTAALFGCTKNRDNERSFDDRSGAGERTGTTTVTGAGSGGISNETSIARIVAARCGREQACNNIGPDRPFTNPGSCSTELRPRVSGDLNSSECPRGIDAKELDECLDAIRTESCNNPIETISRLAACRTSDMCLTN